MGMRENFSQSLDLIGNMAVNGTLKAFLDGGPTINEITVVTDLDAADFTLVVEIDGDRRVEISGARMLEREAYEGKTATSGQFVFSFGDFMAKTLQGEVMSGLATQPGERVLVSLELAASGVAGTEVATLYLETSANRKEEFRLYCIPEDVPISKAGKNTFDKFRRGDEPRQTFLRRIFAYGTATHLSIKQDDLFPYGEGELLKAVNDARLLRNGKTVPSGCYVFDPIAKGNVITHLFDTYSVKHTRFFFTTSDTTDISAQTEYIEDMRPTAERLARPLG